MTDRDRDWIDFLNVLRRALLMIVGWIDKRLGYASKRPSEDINNNLPY